MYVLEKNAELKFSFEAFQLTMQAIVVHLLHSPKELWHFRLHHGKSLVHVFKDTDNGIPGIGFSILKLDADFFKDFYLPSFYMILGLSEAPFG